MTQPGDDFDIDGGNAGASARREHERRRANREQRTRQKRPRLSGLILALQEAPQHERAWARGADGEQFVAQSLTKRCAASVVLLHDRRIPGSRANIDHIAITAGGVWVIDSKRYTGKVAVSKPLFGTAKLMIAGRDRTRLVDGLTKQVALLEHAIAELGHDVPVHGTMCFVDADLPLLRTLTVAGFPLLYPKALAKRLNHHGPLSAEQARTIAAQLAQRFPPA
jgi:hypothetical protein